MTEQQAPANWYPDPEDASGLRYWDGTQWTEHRAARPSAAPLDEHAVGSSPAETPASTEGEPFSAASTSKPTKHLGYLTILTLAVVVGLVIVVIAVATNGSSKSAEPGSGGPPASDSAGTSGLENDARVIQTTVEGVLTTLGLAEKHPTTANLKQVARVAQEARDSLTSEKDALARHIDQSDANEKMLSDALNGLTDSMDGLVAYTGAGEPATLASFRKQYRPAAAKWNRAVRAIYDETGKALPTIPAA